MAVDVEFLNGNNVNNINTNFQRVKDALQEVVGRNGDLPNHMNADLDMDSNDILNVDTIQANDITIDGTNPAGILERALNAVEAAEIQADRSENEADRSELQANRSEDEADRAQGYADGLNLPPVTAGTSNHQLNVNVNENGYDLLPNVIRASFDTVSDLLNDSSLNYSRVNVGDIITAQDFRYEVAASDATDQHVTTAGGVKLYVLRQAGNVLQPEQWGAVGDGVADDTAVVQACIDLAESLPNSVVNLLPSGVGYGVSETIEFGLGTYNTVYYGAGQTSGGRNSFTFQKIANVVAWRVNRTAAVPAAQPTLIDISVKGRGNDDPTTNDPLIESTPGALIHHRCVVIRPQFMHVGGMAGLDNEVNTNGYALGIYSLAGTPEGNCNYTVVEDIVASFTNGDVVYIGQGVGAVLNQNAMRVTVRNAYGFANGYVINCNRGFENEFHVLHANEIGLPVLGVFRINYIKNYARCVYLEANFHAYGVSFGTDGDNNIVEFLEGVGAVDNLYDTIRSNRVVDLRRGTEYVGGNSGNTQRGVLGTGGFLAEFMKVGLGWANAVNTALMRVGDVVSTGTGSVGIAIFGTGTSGRSMIRFENANGNVGSISINGSSTTYNTTSDATLKDDDGPISFEQARAILDLVQFHNFKWNVSGEEAQGVFAQELYEVYPAAVTRGGWRDPETEEWLDEDNGTEYQPWGVDYSKLVTVLGACLQGVVARQDEFGARLNALEGVGK